MAEGGIQESGFLCQGRKEQLPAEQMEGFIGFLGREFP